MHPYVHLMLATSLSMIVTYSVHSIVNQVTSRNFIFQTVYFDFFRASFLFLRCRYYDRKGKYF